jgi:O-antigen ligase
MIKNLKIAILFAILVLPLGIPVFFHTGSTFDFRIVISSFELLFIIFFSFFYLKKESQYDLPRYEFILFVLWVVYASIAVVLSDHYAPATIRQWEWFCQILFSFCLWAFLKNNQDLITYAHLIVITGFLLVCAGLVVYWNILPDPYHYDWVSLTPNFINIRHFSHYCTVLVILCSSFLLSDSKRYSYLAGTFLLLSICWGFLFWTGGRAGIGSAAVGLFLVCLLSGNKKKSVLVIILFACLSGYLLSEIVTVKSVALGFLNSIQRTTSTSLDNFLSVRIELWLFSQKWINACPFFGLGPDGFRFFPDADFIYHHPHNTMVQLTLDWGVPGILLFVYLQYRLMLRGFKKLSEEKRGWLKGIKIAAFSWIAASVIFGLADGVYYFAIPLTLTFYSFAMIFLPTDDKESQTSQKNTITINRTTLRVAVSVLVMILALHICVLQSLKSESVPGPFSIRGTIVRIFPSRTKGFEYRLEEWIEKWAQDDPDTALAAAIRFAENSPKSKFFWTIAAKIKMDQGDIEGAKLMRDRAVDHKFEWGQY